MMGVRRAVVIFVFDIVLGELNFPDLAIWASTSFGRAGTGLYGKTSWFWTVALTGAFLFRRQKNQSETMTATSAIPPPTVPPTMAPKLRVVEGAVGVLVLVLVPVGVGVLVNWDDSESEVVGVGVLAETVGSEIEVIELLLATEVLEGLNQGISIVNSGPMVVVLVRLTVT